MVVNLSDTPNLCILARSCFYFTFLLVMDSDHSGGGYSSGEIISIVLVPWILTGLQNSVIYVFPRDITCTVFLYL